MVRHRRTWTRYFCKACPWGAHQPSCGRRSRYHCPRNRRCPWSHCRIFRREIRQSDYENHGYLSLDPDSSSRHYDRGRPRDEHDESDDCHRPCQYADLCQSRPGLGFKRQGSGIRGGSQGYRREKFPYYRPPHCAQLSFTDHCPGDAPCGNGYPLHGVLKLHRPRH